MQEAGRQARISFAVELGSDAWLDECTRAMPALELAILRRGVEHRDAAQVRCAGCRRTPLIGERVYLAEAGLLLCELCRSGQPATPVQCRVVRGPNSGRSIRVIDQRAA